MTCLPPFYRTLTRRFKNLFTARSNGFDHTSQVQSSSTEFRIGSPETKAPDHGSPGDDISLVKSLVCDFCWNQGLFSPGPFQQAWISQTSYRDFSITTSWNQIQHSADKGCQWCRLLLSTKTEATLQETVQYTIGFRLESGRNSATPKGAQTLRLGIDGTPHSVYYVYTGRDNAATPLIVARPRILKLNASSTFSAATTSIMECIRAHEHCPTPHSTALPTRVVDCSDPLKPRLHAGKGENASYVTLSYVVGNEDLSIYTTMTNVSEFAAGIDPTLLPQTIKDAMEATRSLGLRYLWVDSLCILRDSQEDKAREVACLATTYRNAYFTIIAAPSRHIGDGFLQDRAPPSPPDIPLPFRFSDGQVGRLWLSPAWRQYDESSEPVNQRAWCFVERLLSPRALVYASHTLQFRCQTVTNNVGSAICAPTSVRRLPRTLFHTEAEMLKSLTPDERRTLQYAWSELVGEYTQRTLGRPADKLVAISPIAELFRRAWRSEYLAGLWRDTLVEDLLWYKNFGTRHRRPEAYRAPSWSWAAIDGRIMAHTDDDRLDPASSGTESCVVVACAVIAATPLLPLGEVANGLLTIRTVLVPATWNPDASLPDLYLQPLDAVPGQLELPRRRPSASDGSAFDLVHIGCAYPDSVESVHEVWAVPIKWSNATEYAAGLIVARAMEGGAGRFRRVGYFRTPDSAPTGGLAWMSGKDVQDIVLV